MSTDQRLDDLATLYVGLAHGLDGRMHFNEFAQIADHLANWQHPGDRRDVLELVEVSVRAHGGERVRQAVRRLSRTLSDRERRAVMDDLSEIALADRRFLQVEAEYIGAVAEAWGVHPGADERGAFWSVLRARTLESARSMIHDLALLYLTVAVVPDEEIDAAEIEAVQRAVSGWLPEALPSQVQLVVQAALIAYGRGITGPQMDELLNRVRETLPGHQAAAVASDLRKISLADGAVSVEERAWIAQIEEKLGGMP